MNQRSESGGVVVAIGVAVMLALLLVVGAGVIFFLFTRQTQLARAQEAMARAAEADARQSLTQVQAAMNSAEVEQLVQKNLAETPEPTSDPSIDSAIETVLKAQESAWNAGNIDEFMQHYWKSDELTFSSGGQTTRGWDATLKRYRERYPTPEKMGKLSFDQLEVSPLSDTAALVLGQWQVQRESEPLRGNFSLVVRKIDGRLLIIHDHTSRFVEM